MLAPVATAWHATTPLLPHQQEAVAKLLPTRVGALFMEMGTGKTRTAVDLIRIRQAKIDKVVWFCPVSLKETIRREILKHTDIPASGIHVFDDKTDETNVPSVRWYIVGTESMSASARVVCTVAALVGERTFVVVDESSYLKGHSSRRTERITFLSEKARYRLILTGTPISQGIVDLFSQMRFLSPRILGYRSFYTFERNHLVYSERFPGRIESEKNKEYLASRIKPYVYQVTKNECLTLPEKLTCARYTRLTGEQLEAYADAKERILTEDYLASDGWECAIAIFRLFSLLQGIVCGFERRADGTHRTLLHTRLALLLDTLDELPTEPVVIWAKYHHAVDEITAALRTAHGADSVQHYHGKLSERARQEQLDRWRNGGRFLVATQSAGGFGLDLTNARYVVYYANGFKYAERIQTEDRCHRIGQKRAVTYIDLWSDAGIEDRIATALARKEDAVKTFRNQMDAVRKTNKDSLRELVKRL